MDHLVLQEALAPRVSQASVGRKAMLGLQAQKEHPVFLDLMDWLDQKETWGLQEHLVIQVFLVTVETLVSQELLGFLDFMALKELVVLLVFLVKLESKVMLDIVETMVFQD